MAGCNQASPTIGRFPMSIARRSFLGSFLAGLVAPQYSPGADPPAWLQATAYAIPKETTNQGSGYFSIVSGLDGKLYIGCAKYGVNAYLVEFDPGTNKLR